MYSHVQVVFWKNGIVQFRNNINVKAEHDAIRHDTARSILASFFDAGLTPLSTWSDRYPHLKSASGIPANGTDRAGMRCYRRRCRRGHRCSPECTIRALNAAAKDRGERGTNRALTAGRTFRASNAYRYTYVAILAIAGACMNTHARTREMHPYERMMHASRASGTAMRIPGRISPGPRERSSHCVRRPAKPTAHVRYNARWTTPAVVVRDIPEVERNRGAWCENQVVPLTR